MAAFNEPQERNQQSVLASVASAALQTYTEDYSAPLSTDLKGNLRVVEEYNYFSPITASAQVKATPGFLHTLTITQNDAAPTAGTITVYDNAAATGTVIWRWTFTTAVFLPFSILLDVKFATALYIDITTAADVNVMCSYR